jgi:hypothetical protein
MKPHNNENELKALENTRKDVLFSDFFPRIFGGLPGTLNRAHVEKYVDAVEKLDRSKSKHSDSIFS